MIDPDLPIPLYRQLGDVLRARLKDGEFPVGALFPSEPQLCELYGVSRITVIRALNELARAGLLVRRRGLGTFVLRTARPDEAGERPRVFAYVTPQIDSDWNTQILAGLESALASLRTLGVPLVFVDRDYEDVAADRVKADDEQAGYLATRHLLGSGHRRIAFLGWVSLPQTAQERRLVGYQRALDDAHVEPALFVLSAGGRDPLHESDDREALLNSLERRQISAVVCSTDFLAVTVERFLLSEGVGIPDDIAVVGISDERLAATAEIPLTTVRIPARQLGAEAARLLMVRDGKDRSGPKQVIVPVELVIRASCGDRSASRRSEPLRYDTLVLS